MAVIISTDSTCDLDYILKERNIPVVPLKVNLGDKVYKDGVDITPQMIFDHVAETKKLPKTAARSIEDYLEFFRSFTDRGDSVVHINISEKASASHHTATMAAQEIGGNKVFVLDSKALSTGQGLMVLRACDLRDQGLSAEAIATELRQLPDKIQTSFVVDTLDFLHKGGRCSLLSLYGAKFLKLHPFIDMVDGQLTVRKKYMGSLKKCLIQYVDDLAKIYPDYDDSYCFITHSQCDPALVEIIRQKVQTLFHFKNVYETFAGSVVTSHCGQGTLGVLFIKK